MSLNQTKILTAGGGGGEPYVWTLTGGGTLSVTNGTETTYTAPATNTDCLSNATITVMDFCGQTSVPLKIAINGYNTNPVAATWGGCTVMERDCRYQPGFGYYSHTLVTTVFNDYYCNGTFQWGSESAPWAWCVNCESGESYTADPTCTSLPGWNAYAGCATAGTCDGAVTQHCGATYKLGFNDIRTAEMKTNGCCPQQLF
jgi:hypothetical protein